MFIKIEKIKVNFKKQFENNKKIRRKFRTNY